MEKFIKTPLERAVLDRFFDLYGKNGFPPTDTIRVVGRQSTPCGRYVDLESAVQTQIDDGYLDLGESDIELKTSPHAIMAVVLVTAHRVMTLEFVSYGGASWDGNEDGWSIV